MNCLSKFSSSFLLDLFILSKLSNLPSDCRMFYRAINLVFMSLNSILRKENIGIIKAACTEQ